MRASIAGSEIRIDDCFKHKESIKEIEGRRYDGASKAWFAPLSKENAELLQTLGAELDEPLKAFVGPVCEVATEDEKPICRMPIKAIPYKHQTRAFNFILRIFGGSA